MSIAARGDLRMPEALRLTIEPDPAIDPRRDFYRHVNQRWIDALVLPPYRAEATMLSLLSESVRAQVAALVNAIAGRPPAEQDEAERQIAALHESFMNEDRIETLGAAAFEPGLAMIRSARSRKELSHVMGRLQAQGVGGALEVSVAIDSRSASRYVLVLSQGGIGLPAPLMLGQAGRPELLPQYAEHLRTMLGHAGVEPAAEVAATVFRLESALAAGHARPGPDGRHGTKRHRCLAGDLAARQQGLAWSSWLDGLGDVPCDAIVELAQPQYLAALEQWWEQHDLEDLRAWLIWRYVHEMVPFGARAVFADNFRFYGQALNGLSEPRPRPMRAVSIVETFFGDVVGRRYVAEHVDAGVIGAARELVAELTASFRARLERADWLRESTRATALRKLESMVFEIGSPSAAQPAAAWPADPADLIGNVLRGRAEQHSRELARLGRPVDRSEWKIDPHQATAYYRHGLNQVVVPAAVLQEPLFRPGGDPARNFAVLGVIVGHEMTHAFDNRGAQYDEIGRVRNWWAQEDRAELRRRIDLLAAQFSAYSPSEVPGLKVSGARTAGETVADIVGLRIALHAFAGTLRQRPRGRGTGPGLTPGERAEIRRFFMYWAAMWRARCTPERMRERISSDRHAPPEFRCNGVVGHIEEFYDAFDVAPGDPLYIEPGKRFKFI
ncbi:MAG TPA: M13 family metallopeptidase [Streptosporangiaceae bacterium]|nr:M13 family metallopeptidase [Streptosporangiaceae bacterium]